MSSLARRLLTAALLIPAVLALVFLAPGELAFAVFVLAFFLAALELLPMARAVAPSAPVGSLRVLVPLAAVAGFLLMRGGERAVPAWWLLGALSLVVAAAALTAVFGGAQVRDSLAATGILAFAVPFFAVPPIGLWWLQQADPWLLIALFLIVWIGDTAAFAVGKAIGRHKLAPAISPGKTWEGTVAGFLGSLLAAGLWSLLRLGEARLDLLALAALAAVAAQLGDLVESAFKRGAGVKDSSNLLPGHGGFFDRLDAMMLSTPVFVAGIQALGPEALLPS